MNSLRGVAKRPFGARRQPGPAAPVMSRQTTHIQRKGITRLRSLCFALLYLYHFQSVKPAVDLGLNSPWRELSPKQGWVVIGRGAERTPKPAIGSPHTPRGGTPMAGGAAAWRGRAPPMSFLFHDQASFLLPLCIFSIRIALFPLIFFLFFPSIHKRSTHNGGHIIQAQHWQGDSLSRSW